MDLVTNYDSDGNIESMELFRKDLRYRKPIDPDICNQYELFKSNYQHHDVGPFPVKRSFGIIDVIEKERDFDKWAVRGFGKGYGYARYIEWDHSEQTTRYEARFEGLSVFEDLESAIEIAEQRSEFSIQYQSASEYAVRGWDFARTVYECRDEWAESTGKGAALYKTFPLPEVHHPSRRITRHFDDVPF